MYTFQIKSYRKGSVESDQTFYVLSKGHNAGKPLDVPCPNCFTITANTNEEKTHLYWTCYMLWQGGLLRHKLIGSVILFIRIGEFRDALTGALKASEHSEQSFHKTITALSQIDQLERNLRSQLASLKEVKATLVRSTLSEHR